MNKVGVVSLPESWKFSDVKCTWAKKEKKKKIFLCHFFAVFLGCLGDTQFCFRFRQGSNRKSSLGCFLETTDRDAPPCLKVCRHIRDFWADGLPRRVRAGGLLHAFCLCACFRGSRAIITATCTSVRCGTSP